MTIERARAWAHEKPWGVAELQPWSSLGGEPARQCGQKRALIGEIWFERADAAADRPALLLKLLFTSEPLSIQVHPDDAYAQSIGQANGKTEAWYVLGAAPQAKVALGLTGERTAQELRSAIVDGSLAQLIAWQDVAAEDAIFVPAGTIHAVGAGLTIAEIQQRSDATFRLYDHGRGRELHIEHGIASATAGPAPIQQTPRRLSDARLLLVSSNYFVLERIALPANSIWRLIAGPETWLLVLRGNGEASSHALARGDVVFAQSDVVEIHAGDTGMECLVAYAGQAGPAVNLLIPLSGDSGMIDEGPVPLPASPSQISTQFASPDRGRRSTT